MKYTLYEIVDDNEYLVEIFYKKENAIKLAKALIDDDLLVAKIGHYSVVDENGKVVWNA